MYIRIICAVMLAGVVGCSALKQQFGTGVETPALKAARAECRSQADKEAAEKYQSTISQQEHSRIAFYACMEKKGYDRFGKKIN